MRLSRSVSAMLAALILAPLGAGAQSRPLQPVEPPTLPEDFSSGWYVRGDFGYAMPRFAAATYVVTPPAAVPAGFNRATTADSAFFLGAGVGFKYKSFRTDLTIDHRVASRAAGLFPNTVIGGPSRYDARIAATTTLFNVYWDMFTHAGVTPYVGAGVGAVFIGARASADPGNPGFNAVFSGQRTTLGWALMAGLGADLTPQVKADFGYRLVGTGGMRFTDAVAGGPVTFGPSIIHEIRLGLRYMFH